MSVLSCILSTKKSFLSEVTCRSHIHLIYIKKINNANNLATSLSLLADIHVDFQCISSILHRAHEGSVLNAIIYSKTGL